MSDIAEKTLEAVEEAIKNDLLPDFQLGMIFQMCMDHLEGQLCQQ